MLEFEHCYEAIMAKDARFDGWFFTGVTSTGIYCRPSCPARTPFRRNVRFFPTAAAAQDAGFRACKRCRPDAAPGSPEWDSRADLVGRSMRLIADGVVDREGVAGLARRLCFTERHLHRRLVEAVGAGPLALARARRAQTARLLLEGTDVGIAQVALSSGFSSLRQFNATVRQVFAASPSELRRRARAPRSGSTAGLTVRLPRRAPFAGEALIGFLAARAVPGIEEAAAGAYRRSMRLPHAAGVVELTPREDEVFATFWLEDVRDLGPAVNRCRRLLDLDSDPHAILERLGGDTVIGSLVREVPGRRVPGQVDACELAVRAVLGQQVSISSARTLAGRLVSDHGRRLRHPVGTVTHVFPSAGALSEIGTEQLAMPRSRGAAILALASALSEGTLELDEGADRQAAVERLAALPGIGPWTVAYIAMRALRDPDAFTTGDLGVRRGLARLGGRSDQRSAARLAERWRPYRAYATQYLWAAQAGGSSSSGARRVPERLAA